MKHLKHIKSFLNENRHIYNMDELYKMEQWINDFWNKLENITEERYQDIFKKIENIYGEDIASIIDGMYSADKLHYHQNGMTGGIDTHEFIENFDDISSNIDMWLNEEKLT